MPLTDLRISSHHIRLRLTLIAAVSLWVWSIVRVDAFTKPKSRIGWKGRVRTIGDRDAAQRAKAIDFHGEASTSVHVPFPADAATSEHTLPNWMLSPSDSDPFFLGTEDYRPGKDGKTWDAYQKSVAWFGLEVVPVFLIRLERCRTQQQVSAVIQEARSDIRSGVNTITGKAISRAMEKSTFQGGNKVAWRDDDSKNGWILEANLSLTLSIPFPSFLPKPPGFNSIGSRIVNATCRKRLQQNIVEMQEAYLRWARQEVTSHPAYP